MSHNVVATRATRVIARQIIAETEVHGAEAVLRHINDLDPAQFVPLVALLARAAISGEMPTLQFAGQPMKAVMLTEDERRAAHARYVGGKRDRTTIRGEREYQREKKRAARAAKRAMEMAVAADTSAVA